MTTIPTLMDVPVESIKDRAQAQPIDWRRVGLALLAAVPLMLGRAVGYLAWAASYGVAAFMTGYEAARVPSTPETPSPRPRAAVVRRQE